MTDLHMLRNNTHGKERTIILGLIQFVQSAHVMC